MTVECISPAMKRIESIIDRVAPTDFSVLITGESGVGKEVIAEKLYRKSLRREQPFVKVNSAALPDNLIESELYGYNRGAFTGANGNRIGRVQGAHKGTLFFDEIAELNAESQSKLLHILQDGEFTPLGTNIPISVDVRILAASNKDLNDEVEKGRFRQDVIYRLNVVTISVPPLRQRKEDLAGLIEYFIDKYSQEFNRSSRLVIKDGQYELMAAYHWPGNVRELNNFIKHLILLEDARPPFESLRQKIAKGPGNEGNKFPSLLEFARRAEAEAERKVIQTVLKNNGWSRKKTAQILHISYRTLLSKIKKLQID